MINLWLDDLAWRATKRAWARSDKRRDDMEKFADLWLRWSQDRREPMPPSWEEYERQVDPRWWHAT